MLSIRNSEGDDIGGLIDKAASDNGLRPAVLLALVKAESGLNPKAERWGARTAEARRAVENGDREGLQRVIDVVWPDISFGYSQRIVLYHETGDRSKTVENCLQVREHVFSHPEEDIASAARRLAGCFRHPTGDGTPLSALVVYNAGSDRRNDPTWMQRWSGNVRAYEAALAWAEEQVGEAAVANDPLGTARTALDIMWGNLERMKEISKGLQVGGSPEARELEQLAWDAEAQFHAVKSALGLE